VTGRLDRADEGWLSGAATGHNAADGMRGHRGFWLISLTTAVLGALTAIASALLQGNLVNARTVAGVTAALVGMYLVQSWIQRPKGPQEPAETPPQHELDLQAAHARADLVGQMEEWATVELRRSLTKIPDLQLAFAVDAEAVDSVLRRPSDAHPAVERDTHVRDLYERLGHQVLILGEPGAGKTSQLFELALSLLQDARRSPEARVPVVFPLPPWSMDRRPLEDWLADSLGRDFGVSARQARRWLETEHLVPMLDGLDEVAAPHRAACLDAINRFREAHGQLPLVVCSRIQEYDELPARLRLRGALVIQPLSSADVETYVRRRGRRDLAGLRAALDRDRGMRELLTTPLLLNIAAVTYQEASAPAVQSGGTLIERRRRVLADYVDAMLRRGTPPHRARYPADRTVAWLGWLAGAMQAHGQMVFYVDRLQPDWLPSRRQRALAGAAATAVGVVLHVGLTALLATTALAVALGADGLTPAATVGAVLPRLAPLVLLAGAGGAALALAVHDRTIEPMRWSPAAFRRALAPTLVRGAVIGPLLGILGALLVQPVLRPSLVLAGWAAVGLPVGLGVSLWFALAAGYELPADQAPAAPGRDIDNLLRTARFNALVSLLVVGPVVAVVCGLAFWFSTGHVAAAAIALAGLFAVSQVALLSGLRMGGMAYVRHRLLRWLLHRDGCAAPDMLDFLAHAARLNLLRRQGGGYEFVHPLLRQYFAELGEERPARAA